MRFPKPLLLAAAAVAAVSMLAGCSASGGSPDKLKFVNDKSWDFKAFSKVSQDQIDMGLDASTYADQDAFVAFVKQSLRTSKAPALFTWHTGGQLEELVDQGLVAETSTIWKEEIAKGDVAESVKDLYTIDGKQYCTPISVDNWVMYYDKAAYAEYGLQVPTTWQQLMDNAEVLKSNGIAPFWSSGGNPWAFVWFQIILAGSDLQLYKDLAAGKASYTDPGVVDAMNVWLDMEKKGFFSDPGSKTAPETQMKDGKLAMIPFGTWYASTISQVLKEGDDWGAFPIPSITDQGSTPVAIETAPVCATVKSSQKADALKYSQWWMSAKAQTAWSKQQGNLPFNPKSTASTQTFRDIGKEFAEPDKYDFYLRYYEATPTPILTAALDQFTGFMTNPGDPEPYLKGIEQVAKKYWADH
ncbi:extracellular solute-binding protein [Schumannella luteola]|uniref:Multiple sugar transport system substrate-binding protein n=1 Tax=Schumannella luteola TaxID=472059 RepID=A0A852YB45_9MICO|nr:multiple sugar transport system substrate-binding protein [Schumannella luteola]TPX01343.1 extracellular solute-binding protein [Schumannella luteola]